MVSPWGSWSGLRASGFPMSTRRQTTPGSGRIALGLLAVTMLAAVVTMATAAPVHAGSWVHENGSVSLATTPKRVVALNWAATEALLLLGVTPIGIADRDGYSHWVHEPALPEGVHNVGSRTAPSLEAIAELKPDLIVTSSEMSPAGNLLNRIAPTYVISVYKEGHDPYRQARHMLRTLGDMLGQTARAEAVIADVEQTLATQRSRLERAGHSGDDIALVSFLDPRHVRINTPNGMLDTAIEALGLNNVWPYDGNFWGFSVIGLDALAPYRDARLVVISPTLPGLADSLANSPFWSHLPPVRNRQVYQVDPVWTFGGLYPVKRLALLLTDALLAGGSNHVR